MAKFRIDYSWSGSIVIEAETEEDALSTYYDTSFTDILSISEFSLAEEIESVEKV